MDTNKIEESHFTQSEVMQIAKEVFIKGVCLTYHLYDKDEGKKLAIKAWEATYEEKVEKLLELEAKQNIES